MSVCGKTPADCTAEKARRCHAKHFGCRFLLREGRFVDVLTMPPIYTGRKFPRSNVSEFDVIASKAKGETRDDFFKRRANEEADQRRRETESEKRSDREQRDAIREGRYSTDLKADRHKYAADDQARREKDDDR